MYKLVAYFKENLGSRQQVNMKTTFVVLSAIFGLLLLNASCEPLDEERVERKDTGTGFFYLKS